MARIKRAKESIIFNCRYTNSLTERKAEAVIPTKTTPNDHSFIIVARELWEKPVGNQYVVGTMRGRTSAFARLE
eukprot:4095905-Amphidinium_carterae.1